MYKWLSSLLKNYCATNVQFCSRLASWPARDIFQQTASLFMLALSVTALSADQTRYGFGRIASSEEIKGWDIDVRPDGKGLPKGSGSVAQGQKIYDQQCASCHGSFGEDNQYLQIAGGIGSLASDAPIRTTGSKLNYATTLWDYINRAMPFTHPQTLSADQVYALTAYVLHLNDILPSHASLDAKSILQVQLPNRAGFATEHGFKTKYGRPDVQSRACMRNCATAVHITSVIPDYARDAHGELAEQTRPLGPLRGVRIGAGAGQTPTTQASTRPEHKYACLACHGIDKKIVGPAMQDIAARYRGDAQAINKLIERIKNGGVGNWGQVPMPPQPQISDTELKMLAEWIAGGARP